MAVTTEEDIIAAANIIAREGGKLDSPHRIERIDGAVFAYRKDGSLSMCINEQDYDQLVAAFGPPIP